MEGDMKLKAKMILFVLTLTVCISFVLGCGDDNSNAVDSGTDAGICDGVTCELDDSCTEMRLVDGGFVTVLETPPDGSCDPNLGLCMYDQVFISIDCEFGCIEQPGDDVCATE